MTKLTIYLLNAAGIYSGSLEIDPWSALPRCALTPPPGLSGTEVAMWDGAAWHVLADMPPEPPAPTAAPTSVTMRQARLELLKRGLLDDVEAVIAAAGREAKIEWEYAAVVERSNPAVAAVQQQQGLTDAQIDDLFREAAKL